MLRILAKEEKFFKMFLDSAENIQTAAKLFKEVLESGAAVIAGLTYPIIRFII